MGEFCSGPPVRPVSWRMGRTLALVVTALVVPFPALLAQVGFRSAPQSVTLTAFKSSSVELSLPQGAAPRAMGSFGSDPTGRGPLPVSTSWNVDPSQPVALSLVAYWNAPPRGVGAKPLVLYNQPISSINARGARLDDLLASLIPDLTRVPGPGIADETINLLVITQ